MVSEASANCSDNGMVMINCPAAASELTIVTEKIRVIGKFRPVGFSIFSFQVTPEVFAPIRLHVFSLNISVCMDFNVTSELPELQIPNLLAFGLIDCHMLIIRKADFLNNIRIRIITFVNVTIRMLETGTFMNLPHLRHLGLQYDLDQPMSQIQAVHLFHLYCGCRFSWLRSWLNRHPNLGHFKQSKEIFQLGSYYNYPLRDSKLSANCSEWNERDIGSWRISARVFTNDSCK